MIIALVVSPIWSIIVTQYKIGKYTVKCMTFFRDLHDEGDNSRDMVLLFICCNSIGATIMIITLPFTMLVAVLMVIYRSYVILSMIFRHFVLCCCC